MSEQERADYLQAYNKHGHDIMESLITWSGFIGEGAMKCLEVGKYYSH